MNIFKKFFPLSRSHKQVRYFAFIDARFVEYWQLPLRLFFLCYCSQTIVLILLSCVFSHHHIHFIGEAITLLSAAQSIFSSDPCSVQLSTGSLEWNESPRSQPLSSHIAWRKWFVKWLSEIASGGSPLLALWELSSYNKPPCNLSQE